METNVNIMLKQLRKTSGLSTDNVINDLKKYGIDIKAKTLYGYESGISMPNANVFIALCKIYKCDNPMDMFGANSYNQEEIKLIEKYRFISEHSSEYADMINTIIETGYSIVEKMQNQTKQLSKAEAENIYNAAPDTPEELERLCPPIDIKKRNSKIS